MMLPKRIFLGSLLLTAVVIMTGCATTGDYKDDPSRRYRIASNECIRFGHVTGSVGYYACVEKRLGFGKEIASSPNETGQVSAKGESEYSMTSDDYTLECRTRSFTGTRLKQRICAPVAEWAAFDRKNRGKTEQLYRDLDDADVNTGSGNPFETTVGQMPR
ncbi:MAG: hypothetical protein JW896_18455 [Deltaproteobacteria bacterium]|nr:hypothetical protein [Deltaproteobacteria bacterium]